MGRGSRPFETPQTSRSQSHPDICHHQRRRQGVTARAGGRGARSQTNAREQRFVSCSGLGFSSREGTAAASCRPGRARNRDTRCSWRRRRDCWRPNHLTSPLGESREPPALGRGVGCPPGGQLNRLSGVVSGASAKRQRCHGCWKPSWGVAAGGRDGRRNLPGTTGRCETRSQSS